MGLRTIGFDFEADGVCVVPGAVADAALASLTAAATQMAGGRGGARVNEVLGEIKTLVDAEGCLTRIAAQLMGKAATPVRVLVFDKSPERNWGLSWHQDRSVAVKRRIDVPGFRLWTVKSGVAHVEAPVGILGAMLALRLHLDDCGCDNGPLEVAKGSHRRGRLSKSEIRQLLPQLDCAACLASAGDIVAMRGLTVHRSRPAVAPTHRRVLHVDYATCALPGGLEWAGV